MPGFFGFQGIQRAFGGAAFGCHALAQRRRVFIAVGGEFHRADEGVERQPAHFAGAEAQLGGRLLQRLDEIKDIGRAAARYRGNRIHLLLVLQPQRGTDGTHDIFRLRAVRCGHRGHGVQPGDAGEHQRGVLGMARTMR